ncbi:MAG: hypothetical protein EPN91_05170 [Salinibacterium sp.]|nr:MAG: hypothetical protein EPN91_05170 [Salinibacterium sp.]
MVAAVESLPPIHPDHLVNSLRLAVSAGTRGLNGVPSLLRQVLETRAWAERELRDTGEVVRFRSVAEFVRAAPPNGLGSDLRMMERLIRDDAELTVMFARACAAPPLVLADDKSEVCDPAPAEAEPPRDNVPGSSRGNSRVHALDRLEKERPDLYGQVKAEEISAHQAMQQAGFRKRPDGRARLKAAWNAATETERSEFEDWLRTDEAKQPPRAKRPGRRRSEAA